MQADGEGFLHPHIDADKCVDCGRCRKVCPPLNPLHKYPKVEHPIAAINKNHEVLVKSSSGGMFSLLADWIFEHKGVVYGVVMDANHQVYHTAAETVQELVPMRSSKYVQSDTRTVFRSVKENLLANRYVMFTGTPCQVAGLLNYLGKTDCSRLLAVDLVCHGTPSNKMFNVYLQKLAKSLKIKLEDIGRFSFRQEDSWGVMPNLKYKNGIIQISGKSNLYMRLFLSGRLHRPCCYNCLYATPERIGDITIADFWGIGTQRSFSYDVSAGCSLVLPNSEKGQEVFNELVSELQYELRDWSEAFTYNNQLYEPSKLPNDRDEAINALFHFPLKKAYNKFFNPPMKRLRHFVGSVLRKLHLRK